MADSKLTIGELVSRLKRVYPDISSSKLRFLELKGLITPSRSENKYRVYSKDDIKKITFILKMQKDYYMPLDVIKEKLSSMDLDLEKASDKTLKDIQLKLGENFQGMEPKSMTLEEAADRFKVSAEFIKELIEANLIEPNHESNKDVIGGKDLEIIKRAAELREYGIHVKHLKLFENYATRQATFMQQIVLPLILSSNKASQKKGKTILNDLEANLESLHKLLVGKKNRKFLEKHK